jgi:hypothetical protein
VMASRHVDGDCPTVRVLRESLRLACFDAIDPDGSIGVSGLVEIGLGIPLENWRYREEVRSVLWRILNRGWVDPGSRDAVAIQVATFVCRRTIGPDRWARGMGLISLAIGSEASLYRRQWLNRIEPLVFADARWRGLDGFW